MDTYPKSDAMVLASTTYWFLNAAGAVNLDKKAT
jgi:hypothetical protein